MILALVLRGSTRADCLQPARRSQAFVDEIGIESGRVADRLEIEDAVRGSTEPRVDLADIRLPRGVGTAA